jgi:threonine dehydrogenase-like Zn-dependent dehydrogenase
MRALVVKDGVARLADEAKPVPAPGEALVKVTWAGICGTDLEILKGYAAFSGILGHEFVGTVVSGAAGLEGRRVVAEINCVCGRCDLCAGGLSNHCRRRTVLGIAGRAGAFAEFVAVPERNCHTVPDSVDDESAVFTEPLAAAFQIRRQVKLEPRMSVAVLGTGRLGLLVAQVLALAGCRLVAVGRNQKTLDLLDRKRIRAIRMDEIRQFNDQDVVIDCTGSPDGLADAIKLVRPRGTIVMKTTCKAPAGADLTPLVVNEITILGSRCGPFDEALDALASRKIDVASLVTRRMPLSSGPDALALAAQPDQLKVLLKVAE